MNNPNSAIIPAPAKEAKLADYFRHDLVQENFARVLGDRRARGFVMGVMIAAAESRALQECSVQSIYTSAMRAALLGLSVDPSTRQAYLVPFKDKCTLIVGYKGLYDMAVRTGKYRWINVREVLEGEEWAEDPVSGMLTFHRAPEALAKKDRKVIGWYAGFELYQGLVKQLYMSVEQIHEHARRHSKSYGRPDSAWKTNTQEMERKTVLRRLLSQYGYLDPADRDLLESSDENADAPDLPASLPAGESDPEPKRTAGQINEELGFAMEANPEALPRDLHDRDSYISYALSKIPLAQAEEILATFKGNAIDAYNHVLRMPVTA